MYACADTLLGNLTVYEMLAYTAELKNPMHEPFEQKAAKVEQVLQQLGLSGCRGVRIGSQLARGISGARPLRRCLVGSTFFNFLVLPKFTNSARGAALRCCLAVCFEVTYECRALLCRRSVQAREHRHCAGDQPARAVPG